MKARSLSAIAALPLLIGLLCPSSASALVVDWDTLAWNPGDLTTSYEIDSGAAGNDVTVAVTSQNNNTLTTDSTTGIQTPNIGNAVTGGLAQNSFEIAGNLHTNSNVTLTISFNPA